MYTLQQIQEIVNQITYLDWKFRLFDDGNRALLQVQGNGICPKTGERVEWTGRKHAISFHSCRNEIIRTAKLAIDRAVQHEVDEQFRYRGVAIFNPHMNYDLVVEMANQPEFEDARSDGLQGV